MVEALCKKVIRGYAEISNSKNKADGRTKECLVPLACSFLIISVFNWLRRLMSVHFSCQIMRFACLMKWQYGLMKYGLRYLINKWVDSFD